ncbi:zinc ribbon domain-containing protein [Chloroflexota bacterium]
MFCSLCGKELEESDICCPSCGAKAGAVSRTPLSTQLEKPFLKIVLLPRAVAIGHLIIITGAVMMLTSPALLWYTVYGYEFDFLGFNDVYKLSSVVYPDYGFNWYGTTLPLILMIVFASTAIISSAYASATGHRLKWLLLLLSFLSVATLMANFLYLLVIYSAKYNDDVRPHIGWVVALIGSVAIGIGAIASDIGSRKKPLSQATSLPRMLNIGPLIILTGAAIMLITLALSWYSIHTHDGNFFLKFDFLNNWRWLGHAGYHWSGTTLPLILMIVFASIAILSAVYALATGQRFKKIWLSLSFLCAAVIIANFLYLFLYARHQGYVENVIPQIGWILALIGGVAVGIGAIASGTSSRE